MSAVANADVRHVAVRTAPASMPVVDRTAGCTKRMYESATNVVAPPITSVRRSVPRPTRRLLAQPAGRDQPYEVERADDAAERRPLDDEHAMDVALVQQPGDLRDRRVGPDGDGV